MLTICPHCEAEREVTTLKTTEDFKIRGDVVRVDVDYYKCLTCGEEFDDPASDRDPIDEAYVLYRQKNNMLQPADIKDIRKKHGLTQAELSKLLGWGLATLSRYENGALQEESHDKILKLIKEPQNLLKLIEGKPDALYDEKRALLIKELKDEVEEEYSFERIYEERFCRSDPSENSGYVKLNIAKLNNCILFFCKGMGSFKTRLNKLLFYADFKHFKEYNVSITGAQYIHLQYGPVPEKYEYYYANLAENKQIEVNEVEVPTKDGMVTGEQYVSKKEPDFSFFTDSEIKILAEVKERFANVSAKEIKDFSHKEEGYKKTIEGQLISYNYAKSLQI